jgi:hypothetical protein
MKKKEMAKENYLKNKAPLASASRRFIPSSGIAIRECKDIHQ